ncbi:DUF5347 domain-containing protein [Xenorhabdus nematophila]|uniref:DUF5347 family protein n=1 Tax=Xenorhabdus nematophila TaxID=628 RepID=UPI0003275DE8|nr:DUF5347 family protein [Xenorhabdus nematophila]CEE92360.1 conserved hypothetical protein [Xenorhabdus nematophila str. Anatoliense]CEF30737.1 conserved hypothetical protein [Xenorhabdus nematophila str. Websteri]AYA40797.1 hypothetical protein D3790_10400 [Xenorhabdus nematophila]KHD28645.1 hypothetical protein LH67_09705 [Xenorhabdus nematophila]MBA0019545.1 DUF5347 domain-containing protein [Xenorhabdus nematophila]
MANIEKEKFAQINLGQRLEGLNHLSRIRAIYWRDDEKELNCFFADMRDKRDSHCEENKRVLSAIFYLANIPRSRHDSEFNHFTQEEKQALIKAMNHIKVVVSQFPKYLVLSPDPI